jgi:hypothetical protein
MPRYSGFTFSVQPAERNGKVLGFVVSGFLTKKQLEALREIVDNPSKRWRGQYQEMAKAIVAEVDHGLKAAES